MDLGMLQIRQCSMQDERPLSVSLNRKLYLVPYTGNRRNRTERRKKGISPAARAWAAIYSVMGKRETDSRQHNSSQNGMVTLWFSAQFSGIRYKKAVAFLYISEFIYLLITILIYVRTFLHICKEKIKLPMCLWLSTKPLGEWESGFICKQILMDQMKDGSISCDSRTVV
jgi:hypothetical protein